MPSPRAFFRKTQDRAQSLLGGARRRSALLLDSAAKGLQARDSEAVEPASLEELIGNGAGMTASLIRLAREHVASEDPSLALAIGYSLREHPETRTSGNLVLGITHLGLSHAPAAWQDLRQVDDPAMVALASEEWFEAGFKCDPEAAAAMLERVIAEELLGGQKSVQLLKVARLALASGREDLARQITDHCLARPNLPPESASKRWLDILTTWYSDGARRVPQQALPADVRFGVLNYKQPDNSSRNVGDWVQTIASLGHLVRHQPLRFVGEDPDLVEFVEELAASVKTERKLPQSPERTVQLLEVQRDASTLQELPDGTWMLAFGWFMHDTFELGYNFPFNAAIRPIFISFHLNRTDMLTDEVVEYLRRYGPIGCRDWHSVIALQAVGVPAFFSGCITTTVDTVFPPGDPAQKTHVGYVDYAGMTAEAGEHVREQSIRDVRTRPIAENLRLARSWVADYNEKYRKLYTSRLHCYLPATSVGCEVVFEPANRSDIRFGGLIDLDSAGFEAIRQGILNRLAGVFDLILAGSPEEDVYAHWREACAEDVARAERYLADQDYELGPQPDAFPTRLAGRRQVALVSVESGEAAQVPVALSMLATHGPAGLGVLLVGSDARKLDATALSAACGLQIETLTPGDLKLSAYRLADPNWRPSQRELLLAASLNCLPEAERVLVLPTASVIRADLSGLFDLDLGGFPLAAIPDPQHGRQSGAELIRYLGARQGDDWRRGVRFLAASTRGKPVGYRLFDATIMLVDPARLRELGYAERACRIITGHMIGFRDMLNLLVGAGRAELPARFNVLPYFETPGPDAAVVGYRVLKPWDKLFVPFRGEWRAVRKSLAG